MIRDEGFVSRWARRKAEARAGRPVDDVPPSAPDAATAVSLPMTVAIAPPELPANVKAGMPSEAPPDPAANAPAPPPVPTMEDVAALARDAADFSRFVAPQVPTEVRNAAMKKLFSDPHFNVMDGLDVYIDDYSRPDPVPRSMLRSLVQSRLLGLFDDEAQAAPASAASMPAHEAAAAQTPTALQTDSLAEPAAAGSATPQPAADAADVQSAPDATLPPDDEPANPQDA
jgi:hypothetical protein